MNEKELETKAIDEIKQRVIFDGPLEPMVIAEDSLTEWNADLLCNLSEHDLHVLGRGPDIVVFFDNNGKVTGWRDDGRKGTEMPRWIDRDLFLKVVVSELDLPKETQLGNFDAVELPPVGWTYQAVLFLTPVPQPDQILRVWVSPENLRVIQCLYGPVPARGESR